jgi:hypothetical protein
MRKSLIPVAAAVVLLAACGSSGPPSAHSLAAKIPGCGSITAGTPAVMEVQDVTCTLQDGAQIEIGTFANPADEKQWITDGGSPSSPDPAYAGCCIQGNNWAATVGFNNNSGPMNVDYKQVIAALGGREVNG